MKQFIRYFSVGLATASLITLALTTYFDNSKSESFDGSGDEMIEYLQTNGYRVLTESEYITLSVSGEEDEQSKQDENKEEAKIEDTDNKDKNKEQPEIDDQADSNNQPEVKEYTLDVKPNMLGPAVGEILQENGIIEDANTFTEYIEGEGYSKYIQLGKHTLTSDMSTKEIAKKITNK